jgi:Beta-lactamase enzyme family
MSLLGVAALVAVVVLVVFVVRSQATSAQESAGSSSTQGMGSEASQVRLPTASELEGAEMYASKRTGRVSFAVVDTSGNLSCFRCRLSYHSASVVKAMLLVSYLNHLAESGEPLPADHEAYLEAMIRISDNDAATAIYAHVGDKGLTELATEAQMTGFRVSGSWGSAHVTAADQARFFAALDELTAPEYRDYARALLSSISSEQSWGIPEVSRPEWQTFFKGGWLTQRNGSLVHQVARLEQGERTMAIAVLTDGSPSDEYGRETIQGIAARLLGH